MSDESNIRTVNVWARIPEADEKALKHFCTDAGISKPEAIAKAIRLLIEAEAGPSEITQRSASPADTVTIESPYPGRVEKVTAEEWLRVQQILKILRGGVEKAVAPLMTNLDSFEYLTDLILIKGKGHVGQGTPVPRSSRDIKRKMENLRASQQRTRERLERAQKTIQDAEGDGKGKSKARDRDTGTGPRRGGN